MEKKEYVGVIHIHTRYSDGSGSLREVIEAGKKAGVDFLIITDHDVLPPREKEGWYEGILVLFGEEISPSRSHYLALDIEEEIKYREGSPQEYIDEVNRQGGFGFVCHPFYRGNPLLGLRPHPWENFYLYEGFTGIEIWSFMYDWVRKLNPIKLLYYLFFPHHAPEGPSERLLWLWDELNKRRKVVAMGGTDAHGNKFFPFSIFSYSFAFRTVRTHVFSPPLEGKVGRDREKILSSLKEGHSFIALDLLASSRGFVFSTQEGNLPGEEVKLRERLTLKITSPREAHFRLIHNGKVREEFFARFKEMEIGEEGFYRIEGYIGGKPWLFTNPIYVRKD